LLIILGTGDSSNSDLTKLTPQGNFSINLQLPTSLCVYVRRDQVLCMFVSICVYTLFHKKKVFTCFFFFCRFRDGKSFVLQVLLDLYWCIGSEREWSWWCSPRVVCQTLSMDGQRTCVRLLAMWGTLSQIHKAVRDFGVMLDISLECSLSKSPQTSLFLRASLEYSLHIQRPEHMHTYMFLPC
jgi:hypothetical protein